MIKIDLTEADLLALMQCYKFYVKEHYGNERESELYFKLRDAYQILHEKNK